MIQLMYDLTVPDPHACQHRGCRRNKQTCSPAEDKRLLSASQVADCRTPDSYALPLLSSLLHQVADDIDSEARLESLPSHYAYSSPSSSSSASQAYTAQPLPSLPSLSSPKAEAIEAAVREVTVRLKRYLAGGQGFVSFLRAPSEGLQGDVASLGQVHQVHGEDPELSALASDSKRLPPAKTPRARTRGKGPEEVASPAQPAQPARHTLKLCLLGSPQIYIDGVRVSELERSNRRTQVIQLLALHRGSLSCDGLAEALSMTSHQYEDESLRPHYVRNLVWGVREWVRKKVGWGGIIQSPTKGGMGPHFYRLPDNTVCDLWEFEEKLDQADRLFARSVTLAWSKTAKDADGVDGVTGGPGDADRAAAVREEALQLYRGQFCEGSNAGPIVQAARILEERYLLSALQQGDYWRGRVLRVGAMKWHDDAQDRQDAQGTPAAQSIPLDPEPESAHPEEDMAWRAALRNYERVLTIDNYHEEAYRRAMECYAHLGNARGVGQMFTRCQDVLHADLMQPPGEDVVRTYEECKALLGVS